MGFLDNITGVSGADKAEKREKERKAPQSRQGGRSGKVESRKVLPPSKPARPGARWVSDGSGGWVEEYLAHEGQDPKTRATRHKSKYDK